MTPELLRRRDLLRMALLLRYPDHREVPGTLGNCFHFAQAGGGWPERLGTAFRNRIAHGDAFHFYKNNHGTGHRFERRARQLLIAPVFAAVDKGWRTHGYAAPWVPCSAYFADFALNCMQPIHFPGGFALGEASHYDPTTGENVYTCIRKRAGRYEARIDSPRRLRARQAA